MLGQLLFVICEELLVILLADLWGEEIARAYNERRPRPKLTEDQKRFSEASKNLISDNRNFMKADYEFWKDKPED